MDCPDQVMLERYATEQVADPAILEHLEHCESCSWRVIEAQGWARALSASMDLKDNAVIAG